MYDLKVDLLPNRLIQSRGLDETFKPWLDTERQMHFVFTGVS